MSEQSSNRQYNFDGASLTGSNLHHLHSHSPSPLSTNFVNTPPYEDGNLPAEEDSIQADATQSIGDNPQEEHSNHSIISTPMNYGEVEDECPRAQSGEDSETVLNHNQVEDQLLSYNGNNQASLFTSTPTATNISPLKLPIPKLPQQNENGGDDEALQIEKYQAPIQSTISLALQQDSSQVSPNVQDFQSRESPTEKSRDVDNTLKMSVWRSTKIVEDLHKAIEPVATELPSLKRLRSIVNKDGKRLEQDIACLNDRLRLFAYHYMKNNNLQAPLNGEGGYSFTLDALLSSIAQLPSRKIKDFSKSCNLNLLVQSPIYLDSYSKAVTQRFRYLCPNLSQENLSKALCNIIENGPVGQTIGDHLKEQLDVATHAEFLPTNHITPATLPDDCLFIGSTNFFIKPGKLTQPLLNYVTSCFFGHESSKMLRFPKGFPISKNCGHPHTLFICLSSSGILVSSELIKLSKGDEGAKSKDPDPKDLMQKFVDNIHSRERTSKIVYIDPDCSEYAEVEERLRSKGFNARRSDFNNLARLFGSMKMKIAQKEFNQESRNFQQDGPDMRPLFKNEILSLISEGGEQSRKLNEEYKDLLGNNYQHPAKHLPEYMKELSEIKYVLSFTEAEIKEISKGHSPKYWIPQPSIHQSPGAASTPPKKQQRRQQGSAKKSKTVVDSSKVVSVISS
eukprot:TRINITY_DN2183_c0_g1_i2.p1 TRINITY_DN2183_c0_g1~~TRINITY_DN2183_c0_g1_i2.p1  ORF type:complete len:678 (+),score=86.40 TRINITY_DN2183_c0_g1_i2:208-2241(+)